MCCRTLGTAALGLVGWSLVVEPRLFTIRRATLPVLPAGSTPLRVLQLSDLHLAPWQHRKIAWLRSLVELRPDLLVLTGDLLGHRFARGPLLHALQPFADAGVSGVFVHGSNDYFSPVPKNPVKYLRGPSRGKGRRPDLDNAALTEGLRALGLSDLNNDAVRLSVRGQNLELFGLNDPHIRYDQPAQMREQLQALRGAAPKRRTATSQAPAARVGVVHAPYQRALGELLDAGAEVILAGHTHGGQLRLPGVGALTANCDLPLSQARGVSVWYNAENAAFLNVSAGLGASIYAPIRFACRPEASLLTFTAAQESR